MTLKKLLSRQKMPIIVSLPENRMDLAQAAIDAGADALKFHINTLHRASDNVFKEIDDYIDIFKEVRQTFLGPMGIVIGDEFEKVTRVSTSQLKELGFNYYSLNATDIGSKTLLQNDLGHTVAINHNFNFSQLPAIESFNIQAVELSIIRKEDYGKSLHFEDLLAYKSYRDHTRLPLIVPSQKRLVPEDLLLLRNIGIDSIMLGVVTLGKTAESIYNTIEKFISIRNQC